MNEREKEDAINQLVLRFHAERHDVPLHDMLAVAWNMGFDDGARTAVFDRWTEDDFVDHLDAAANDDVTITTKLDDWRYLQLVNAQVVRPTERSFVDGRHDESNVQVYYAGYWV